MVDRFLADHMSRFQFQLTGKDASGVVIQLHMAVRTNADYVPYLVRASVRFAERF